MQSLACPGAQPWLSPALMSCICILFLLSPSCIHDFWVRATTNDTTDFLFSIVLRTVLARNGHSTGDTINANLGGKSSELVKLLEKNCIKPVDNPIKPEQTT